nr:MAG TPA: hypothetical protein [Bacteriophage sp.]
MLLACGVSIVSPQPQIVNCMFCTNIQLDFLRVFTGVLLYLISDKVYDL